MKFNSFCEIDSVKYWRGQLNSANIKNLKNNSQSGGTRNAYTYGLLRFHNWLCNKKFQYVKTSYVNKDTIYYHNVDVQLSGIEHLLALCKNSHSKTEFIFLIKRYLAEISSKNTPSTVKNAAYSIRSFFRENESDIVFHFRCKNRTVYKQQRISMTIEDLRKILTVKNIQPIEKAVFVCKFQRGLDNSTLADRFNFEVWDQLVEHFQTDNPKAWDVKNTPVPIRLVRVKTDFLHVGFLDADAITAIREYLITSNFKPKSDRALFVNKTYNPITVNWISRRFHKLVTMAGLQNTIDDKITNQYGSHEMRDLLKSTLLDSDCRADVADHVIGHVPKDSYEKQALLYPESLAVEFSKASGRINILSGHQNQCKIVIPTKFISDMELLPIWGKLLRHLEVYERRILNLEKHIKA